MSQTDNPAAAGTRPFIPAWVRWLRDSGLPPHDLRVCLQVITRGDCWESVDNMAAACKMNRKTVKRSLQALVKRGFLTRTERPGQTTIYTLSDTALPQPRPNNGGDHFEPGVGAELGPLPQAYFGPPPQAYFGSQSTYPEVPIAQRSSRAREVEPEASGEPDPNVREFQAPTSPARPPTLEEVKTEASLRAVTEETATQFFDHYESNGWTISNGGTTQPIANWRARLRTWKTRHQAEAHQARTKTGALAASPAKPTTFWELQKRLELAEAEKQAATAACAFGPFGDVISGDVKRLNAARRFVKELKAQIQATNPQPTNPIPA